MFVTSANYQTFNVPFVAITKQNSKTVEKELANDPKYNGKKYGGYDPKGRFKGADSYWQERIDSVNNNTYLFADCLQHVVETVNESNATLLSKSNMAIIASKIFQSYKTLNGLTAALSKNPFVNSNPRSIDTNHILFMLLEPLPHGNSNCCYLSFTSKLCHFLTKILHIEDIYSKYDSVVAEKLPIYTKYYLDEELDKKRFLSNDKRAKAVGKKQMYAELYANYCLYIDKIIEKACPGMTREEFDHIVWYTNK